MISILAQLVLNMSTLDAALHQEKEEFLVHIQVIVSK